MAILSTYADKYFEIGRCFIKGDRLRHAKPAAGKYQEKEEDDLPSEAQ
jgi:hypothetical protein